MHRTAKAAKSSAVEEQGDELLWQSEALQGKATDSKRSEEFCDGSAIISNGNVRHCNAREMRSKELLWLRYARDKKRNEPLWQNIKTWRYSMKTLTSEQIRQFICGYLDIDPNTFEVVRHLFQQMDICAACEDAAKSLGVNVDVE